MTDKPKLGRPSTYTPELAAKICLAIATHDCSIKKLHAKYDWFPDCSTIYNWLYIHGEIFSTHYFEARKAQSSLLADSMLDLEKNIPTFLDEKGNERIDYGMLGRAKLSYEIKKWHAAKMAPKIWGEQKQVEDLQADKERLRQELEELRAQLDAKNKKEF